MIERILRDVRRVWRMLRQDDPIPDSMHYVLQSRRRVIFLLFSQGYTNYPAVVVKMTREPGQNHLLEQSVKQAQQVREMLEVDVQKTVPKMVLLEPINGLLGVAEEGMPGHPIETASVRGYRDKTVENSFQAFADWLVRFQSCVQNDQCQITQQTLKSLFYRPLERLIGFDNVNKHLLEGIVEPLLGYQLPLVWAYGDAHPSNILLDNGKVSGVVDWEGVDAGQWPVFDWFQFLLSFGQELIKARCASMSNLQRAVAVSELLIGRSDGPLAAIMRRQTAGFLSSVGLDPELVLPLFLVFLIGRYWFDAKEALVAHTLAQIQIINIPELGK